MRDVAELLERKKTLLDRRREGKAGKVAEVEQELREIDEVLSRLEGKEAAIQDVRLDTPLWQVSKGVCP